MRPLYLSIEGINSFILRQEIDFEALSEANIFCIYGATGSGKTTILDSIILSLYGAGERGDIADYINLSCNKAELVFRFLLDDTVYQIQKVFNRKGTIKAILTNITKDSVIADGSENVKKEVEKMLGLSAFEFTQVVILEQGKFAKFLTSDKSKRSKTVSGLFSLERFLGLSTRFNDRVKAYTNQLDLVLLSLENLSYATSENLENTKQKIAMLSKDEEELDAHIKQLKKQLEHDAISKANHELRVNSQKELLATKGLLKANFVGLEKLDGERAVVEALRTKANEARINLKNVELFLSKISHIESDLELNKAIENSKANLTERYKENDKNAKIINDEIDLKRANLRRVNERLLSLGIVLNEALDLAKAEAVLSELSQKYPDQQLIAERLLSKKEAKESLKKDLAEKIKKRDERGEYLKILSIKEANLFKEITLKQEQLALLFQSVKKTQMHNMAALIASGLNKDDECPVCGGVFSNAKTELFDGDKDGEEKLENIRSELNKLNNDYTKTVTLKETASNEISEVSSKIENINNQLALISPLLENEIEKSQGEIERIKNAVNLTSEALNCMRDLELLEGRLKLCASSRESIITDGKRLGERLKDFFLSSATALKIDEPFKSVEELEKIILQKHSAFSKEAKELEATIMLFEEKKTALEQSEKQLLNEQTSLKAKAEEIERVLLTVKDVVFDSAKSEELNREREAFDIKLKEVVSKKAVALKALQDIEEGIEKREIKLLEHEKICALRDNAELLLRLTVGNKFLEFAEEDYIEQFTFLASQRLFSLTDGKFSLEYSGENKSGFVVVDYLRGGEKRSIKTLSGGEIFLASVSMAIAISYQLAQKQKFDFFFLDEGFGTLDENSIDTAAEALYALSLDTLVGLVTHRSELVEKIPHRLNVTAATELVGSTIKSE